MRKTILSGIGALTLVLASCSEDWGVTPEGGGFISPVVGLDTRTITSRNVDTRADISDLTVEDLYLRLTKKEGSVSGPWLYGEFPRDKEFGVGTYTFEAFYGDPENEGFELPAYSGSQEITVADGKTTPVSVTATLANSMVSIDYTEAFKGYMTDWGATVNGVDYDKYETRPVYVKAGEVGIKIGVTKPNGLSAEFSLDKVTAQPRYHYRVTVDVNEGNVGDAEILVTYDESWDTEEITIDISDKVLSSPKPVIDATGFVSETPLKVIAGLSDAGELAMSLIAQAGIKNVYMQTSSTSLQAQGWPENIDLLAAEGADQLKFGELELKVLGLWKNPGEVAYIDFSDVIRHIAYVSGADNETRFSVSLRDALLRETDPMVLVLNVEAVKLVLSSAGENFSPGEPLNLNFAFNGTKENIEKGDVVFEYKNDRGTWTRLENVKAVAGNDPETFMVTFTSTPELDKDLQVRAKCGANFSEILIVPLAPFEVEVSDLNVFATHAFVKVVGLNGSQAPSLADAKFLAKKKGDSQYAEISSADAGNGYIRLSGFNPGSEYDVKVKIGKDSSRSSSLHTESATELPNGDFEIMTQVYDGVMNLGGGWNTSSWDIASNYYNTVNYSISEPLNWATTNAKTLNILSNTWFAQPSVFNTGIFYESSCPGVAVLGTGKGSDIPASFKGFSSHSGNNAVVIRNVAWDQNGKEPAKDTSSKLPANYYNKNVPTIANKSVGKLFLGSYSYANGSENYNEGISFGSRPSQLTGYYTYTRDKGDANENGVVSVTVYDASDNVIASGTTTLNPTSTYEMFTVPLTYNINSGKASKICVMAASSNHASKDMKEETNNVKVTTYSSKYEAYQHGATLVVDDFKFVY